jgi:hypothetical protein
LGERRDREKKRDEQTWLRTWRGVYIGNNSCHELSSKNKRKIKKKIKCMMARVT